MKPATPLPWKFAAAVQNNGPNYFVVGTGRWGEPSAADCAREADAAYVAHAANAYPRLVEVLRALADSSHGGMSAARFLDDAGMYARALLRELGEG